MPAYPHPQDQPSRDGGVSDPTAAQLDGATADGAPTLPTDGGDIAFEAELAMERDRNLRLRAELENLRARSAREVAQERQYAAIPLVRDLLPVLDNIDRAIAAAQQQGDSSSLLEGIRMVRQQLVGAFERHDCKLIDAEGAPFDPQLHEAILQQPSNTVPANHVTMVTQSGYQQHDRVVRPAQVIVSSGPG